MKYLMLAVMLSIGGAASAEGPVATVLTPEALAYFRAAADADLSSARGMCFEHSEPTGHLLGCAPFDRMCNRTYTWPECRRIDELWQSTGAADRAAERERKADEQAHEFVKGLAK